jgi:hypothetical protein
MKDELRKLTKAQLCSIALYYGVPTSEKEKKETIIDKLVLIFPPLIVASNEETTGISVRIRRIKESQNE